MPKQMLLNEEARAALLRGVNIMSHAVKATLGPKGRNVVIDKRYGSLIIPDSAKEKPQEGQVIAVGTGRVTDDGKTLPLALKQGDRILFGKYSGSEVKLDGEELLIMKEEDVLGIVGA